MIDIQQNNYLLPLRGENIDSVDYVLSLGIKARARMERTPIHAELNDGFWVEHFRQKSHRELIALTKSLGLVHRKKAPKMYFVETLSQYFQKVVSR